MPTEIVENTRKTSLVEHRARRLYSQFCSYLNESYTVFSLTISRSSLNMDQLWLQLGHRVNVAAFYTQYWSNLPK